MRSMEAIVDKRRARLDGADGPAISTGAGRLLTSCRTFLR